MAMPSILSNAADVRRRRQDEESRGLAVAAEHLRRQRLLQQQQQTVAAKPACQLTITPMVPLLLPRTSVAHTNGKVVIMAAEQGRSLLVREPPPRLPPGLGRSETFATTGAIYRSIAVDEAWSTPSLFGLRRDRLLFLTHSFAAAAHFIFLIVTSIITAQSADPYLSTWRQQFVFTRNTTTCGRDTVFNASIGEDPIVAVLVPSGQIHVGAATACFFALSCGFSLIWMLASTYDPLGRVLLGWLSDACAPLRWLEYSASASLMVCVLLLISGGRSRTDLASVFVLMAMTMVCGYLTEVISRPDVDSDRWEGQKADGSNRFRNYVWRMQAHVIGFVPYFSAWSIVFNLYQTTIEDVKQAFGEEVSSRVPTYIYTALVSTIVVFSSFTLTQIIYQWRPPARYWETELIYAFLSLTSKAILGGILLGSLITQDNARDGAAG